MSVTQWARVIEANGSWFAEILKHKQMQIILFCLLLTRKRLNSYTLPWLSAQGRYLAETSSIDSAETVHVQKGSVWVGGWL